MTKNYYRLPDWRILTGALFTVVWLGAGVYYLFNLVGWSQFLMLPTGEIGSFLEGAFAPLAFLWLVIGHFMQQTELSSNTKAIQVQEESAKRLELHSRRDSYFKLLNLVQDQLGGIAAFHYYSIAGPTDLNEIDEEKFAELRSRSSNGDHALFVRRMLFLCRRTDMSRDQLDGLFFGTEIRQRHTLNYSKTFAKLHQAAKDVDTEDIICNALVYGSAIGRLYRTIEYAQGETDNIDIF